MVISGAIAKAIVDEIQTIINEDMNFIDTRGIIIYSTDKSRISTFHKAGFRCVNENREVIVKDTHTYRG